MIRSDRRRAARSPARTRLGHLMKIVGFAAVVATACAIAALWLLTGPMPLHMLIATVIGVMGTVLLGGGLMALVFMSAGTGHDDRVHDFTKEDR